MMIEQGGDETKEVAKKGGMRRLSGALLAVIGILWLAKKAGWMPAEQGHSVLFWPVVVIAAGLFLFFGARHRHAA